MTHLVKPSKYLSIALLIYLCSCTGHKPTIKLFTTSKPDRLGVKSSGFRGTLFTKQYAVNLLMGTGIFFTPNKEEIQQAEAVLSKQIHSFPLINQGGGCPIIRKNLTNYFRQYVGVVDANGHKLIHINFRWDKFSLLSKLKGTQKYRLTFESDYKDVLDGCSYHWSVNIDLSTNQACNFSVNGSA